MKKQYILLKEAIELKVGAILIEKCEDGNQGFICEDKKYWKFSTPESNVHYNRQDVMKQPKWFKEIRPIYLTPEEITKVKKLLKKKTL